MYEKYGLIKVLSLLPHVMVFYWILVKLNLTTFNPLVFVFAVILDGIDYLGGH